MSTAVEQTNGTAWREWRRQGIGASDVAAILGISPWASPWSVWADKLGLLPDEHVDDDDPRTFGKYAEAMIVPWFRDRTGLDIVGEQTWCRHVEHPHHQATVDGFAVEDYPAQGDIIGCQIHLGPVEIKAEFHSREWPEIPAWYQAQGQWQCHVTDSDVVWFAVLHGRKFRTYQLQRNQADIDLMVDRVNDFWAGYVRTGQAPPVDGHDATAKAISAVHPEAVEQASVAIDELAPHLQNLSLAKARRKAADADIKHHSNTIKAALGDAYEGTVDGERAVTCGTQTRKTTCTHCGAVDESAPFRVLRPTKGYA